jgi:apolipoprotein N-acyltransferase
MLEDVIATPPAGAGGARGAGRRTAGPGSVASRPVPAIRRWWALAAAVGAGPVMLLAFPPIGLWWCAPLAVALLALAVHRRGFWAGAGLGLLTGVTFFVPILSWAGGYVGPVWLILPGGESLFVGLLGGLGALASPVFDRWRWSLSPTVGALWVLQEAVRDRVPFGGFPWGRLAFSQADSPLLPLAALGGAPLVTFAVGAVGGLVAVAALTVLDRGLRAGVRPVLVPIGIAVLLSAAPLVLPAASPGDGPVVSVVIVQGNVPRLGLDFNAQRRLVLDNHANATVELAAEVAAGRAKRPDLVVWPENASDIDPLVNADARAVINGAARAIGVPILVGGLLQGPGDRIRNVGIVWEPDVGPTQTYVKRHPVPFAEYMPIRSFARLITDKVDLVRSDFVAGPTPGVMRVGPATVGDVICFEVAYDEVVRDTVTGGANLLVVQTNNATFNEAEATQQLAMVRLRAVEHGRPALMASTVGVSAFVDPDGRAYQATDFNARAVIAADLRLRSARTMATELGALPELALVIGALGVIVIAMVRRRREVVDEGEG